MVYIATEIYKDLPPPISLATPYKSDSRFGSADPAVCRVAVAVTVLHCSVTAAWHQLS